MSIVPYQFHFQKNAGEAGILDIDDKGHDICLFSKVNVDVRNHFGPLYYNIT